MAHVAIVGSREFPEPDRVRAFVNTLPADTVVVTGGARGVDTWAEKAARARGLRVMLFLPDFTRYRKGAPRVRNQKIVLAADYLVAFHDGHSEGTAHAISLAAKFGKLRAVHLPTPDVEP